MSHVVLVGMMGAGKTTIAPLVAERLGMQARDVDQLVTEQMGAAIAEIFESHGEDAFRLAESEALLTLLNESDAVISTGGGIVLSETNRKQLDSALVIWLRATPATLLARIDDPVSRPLLGANPKAALEQLNSIRSSLYEQVADVIVDVDGLTEDEVAVRVGEAAIRRA